MSKQNSNQDSNKTNTLSRRNFLKGAAYTSALSIGGLSSLAFATGKTDAIPETLPTVTLFNQSDKTVSLDAWKPVSLEKVNGWVVVKINKAEELKSDMTNQQTITLGAGQRLSFAVDSELAPLLKDSGDYIVITNEYSALNNMVPISTYDTLVA